MKSTPVFERATTVQKPCNNLGFCTCNNPVQQPPPPKGGRGCVVARWSLCTVNAHCCVRLLHDSGGSEKGCQKRQEIENPMIEEFEPESHESDQPLPVVVPEAWGHTSAEWDPKDLDSLEDEIRESVANGKPIRHIVARTLEAERLELMQEGAACALSYMLEARSLKAAAAQLMFVSGIALQEGKSSPELARECGMSKQAFQQAVARLKQLFLNRIRRPNERTNEAKEKMSKRNSRNRRHS